jgi:succinyl-CoA synthetase beta subunit
MNIHEYQAKAVLREFGVPVPRGVPAFSVDEAVNGAKGAGRSCVGREGADSRRRPRQGWRR